MRYHFWRAGRLTNDVMNAELAFLPRHDLNHLMSTFFFNEQLVSDLEGVDVSCDPPDFAVKLQDSNTFQWTFTLMFKVSKMHFKILIKVVYYLSTDNSETPNRVGNRTTEIMSPY